MKRRKREGERERRGTKVEKERRERAGREKETNEYEGDVTRIAEIPVPNRGCILF